MLVCAKPNQSFLKSLGVFYQVKSFPNKFLLPHKFKINVIWILFFIVKDQNDLSLKELHYVYWQNVQNETVKASITIITIQENQNAQYCKYIRKLWVWQYETNT